MYIKHIFFIYLILIQWQFFAQETIDSIQKIGEVIIESQRLAIPFSKTSHSISVVTAAEIVRSNATTIEEVLQHVVGVDIRTKGIEGMQADLYIRGGNFNQTLLLIDGIKMDDLQTGHHTLNGLINIENVKRIEIIKGAAARIYGQNAMNGAVNIVTKDVYDDSKKLKLNLGSFENYGALASFQKQLPEGSVQFQIQKQVAEGYRFNTDFNNFNAFLKGKWKDYTLMASFAQRNFGANGFYASPKFIDQYEETQTNLIALKANYKVAKWNLKPKLYWRQNQDMFVLFRDKPDLYRNMHINNKIGISLDASVSSVLGKTGIGVDINKGLLRSNNLGDRQRLVSSFFVEQRFQFWQEKLNFTPGIAVAHYSDFGFFAFPGMNIGYRISPRIKLYADVGYTSRIPTFTNLYYSSKIEQGNPNLKPEKALTYEAGLHFSEKSFNVNIVYFERKATDLIDWVKASEADLWQAKNVAAVQTKGLELESKYMFLINTFPQRLKFSYALMDDRIIDHEFDFSRYSLNSYKHQLIAGFSTKFFSLLDQSITYRYSERTNGEAYHLLDASLATKIKKWEVSLKANNLLNTVYTESNLVPMPLFNYMFEVAYIF